ncbi:hypothetical protein E0H51_31630 [Rhizobium leguminosarum bv. viciae]|uniref:hypothetical protein n=1 Tax=Rhizobium leguminosarum TaxID=384 RepID=UPI0010400A3A|nr:hypothetical protein [Rhizobium leguminosarum]TBY68961.1 hypothetical protein E0H51_31630 [Rhizobium leguminosarum bv. viciae]
MKISILAAITAILLGGTAATQAAEYDINGMALGMSADQVIAKFQELRPDAQYEFAKWKLPEGTEWVANGRTLYNDLANPDDMEHEWMQFAFTGLGSGNKLFAASRELKFRPSQRPTTESVYAAAVQKFGEPSVTGKSVSGIWAAWKFSSADANAEKLESPLGCIGTSDFPVGLDEFTAKRTKQSASMCGIYIDFVVRGDPTGLANELEMKMIDQLHLAQDFDADNSDARKRIDAAKAKSVGNAAPAPKL